MTCATDSSRTGLKSYRRTMWPAAQRIEKQSFRQIQ
ncbi:hypothetical protein FOIG_16822 [Fusarium odoratissimum NRRL 54006]|uniref:Uncharacterized protein n=1 Tax=Fusarium odoratissimum (strain NRRL 54006) TaxID=1089451 RepID=X0IM31_FUSO5|nr:uncharacterized protein FOIG_16822 [Fusarium odoratissimum NRRL 54006]EXL89897.1 hypothetical protein FOIG_16822 [Fusarium odoratissimum NRRL 54006]